MITVFLFVVIIFKYKCSRKSYVSYLLEEKCKVNFALIIYLFLFV